MLWAYYRGVRSTWCPVQPDDPGLVSRITFWQSPRVNGTRRTYLAYCSHRLSEVLSTYWDKGKTIIAQINSHSQTSSKKQNWTGNSSVGITMWSNSWICMLSFLRPIHLLQMSKFLFSSDKKNKILAFDGGNYLSKSFNTSYQNKPFYTLV